MKFYPYQGDGGGAKSFHPLTKKRGGGGEGVQSFTLF